MAAKIEGLLKDGKNVAILVIDMQEDFWFQFVPEESTAVISAQRSLLEKYSGREGVLICFFMSGYLTVCRVTTWRCWKGFWH